MIALVPQTAQRHRSANGLAALGPQSQLVSGCFGMAFSSPSFSATGNGRTLSPADSRRKQRNSWYGEIRSSAPASRGAWWPVPARPCRLITIGWVGALTVCDVASTSGVNTSFRESVAARSGNDKPSCNAGGPRRCWTEPAKTHQQRSRCVGQQA